MLFRKSLMYAVAFAVVAVLNGCCGGPGVSAKLSPIENVTGWVVVGDWELQGILSNFTDDPNDLWEFRGSLTFPTTGYSMAQPEIKISESDPEHVTVRLMVIPPALGESVENRRQRLNFLLEFDVSEDATFDFYVVTHCNGQDPPCGGDGSLSDKFSLDLIPGYLVESSNFFGFLIYDPFGKQWQLQGAFVFLTGGHTAEVVDVSSGGTPTTTTIRLRVTPPPFGLGVPQFIQTIPISLNVDSSVSTLFDVVIETACSE